MITKAWILYGPRDLRLEERQLDPHHLAPDEVYVQTTCTAISPGTERGNYAGSEDVPGEPACPRWLGYNSAGTVLAVGSAVTRFQPGDRVFTTQPHQSASIVREGAIIVPIPNGVPAEHACLTYLYFLGFHALLAGQFFPGENVAVVGTGILGLTTISMAQACGAYVIALSDSEYRMGIARKVGAHHAWRSDEPGLSQKLLDCTDGVGIDLVVLCANPWPAYRAAVESVRPGGRVSVLSLVGRGAGLPDFNALATEWFYAKNLSIRAVGPQVAAHPYPLFDGSQRFAIARGCRYVLRLMQEGRIQPADLITHRLPYQQAAEAYEMLLDPDTTMIGAILDWQ